MDRESLELAGRASESGDAEPGPDLEALVKRALELVEAGVAGWSGDKPAGARRWPRTRAHGKSASALVLEDRR